MSAQLIILTGAPGSGKSLLAGRLRAHYGCLLLDKDTIKEALFDTLGAGDALWSRALSNAAFAVQFALAGTLLARRQTVLLEGNFRPGEHEAPLRRLLAAQPVVLAQILVEAAPQLRAARLAARALDAGRHAGHADSGADVQAAPTGALNLPGALLRVAGDGDEEEFTRLCGALDQRWSTSSTSA
jgi:predicted kinase